MSTDNSIIKEDNHSQLDEDEKCKYRNYNIKYCLSYGRKSRLIFR